MVNRRLRRRLHITFRRKRRASTKKDPFFADSSPFLASKSAEAYNFLNKEEYSRLKHIENPAERVPSSRFCPETSEKHQTVKTSCRQNQPKRSKPCAPLSSPPLPLQPKPLQQITELAFFDYSLSWWPTKWA